MTSDVVAWTTQLVERQSVTPADAGCQELMSKHLGNLEFDCESMPFGDVTNLWARHGNDGPILCFAGHTDVVPTGPVDQWSCAPFDPTIRDGMLYGRGAADMKGSLAAMMCAAQKFIREHPDHKGSLAFLITSDEEGPAVNGTKKVVDALQARGIHLDYCVVGEPSSRDNLGDLIRIGRRGSLNGTLTVRGQQGHVAFPEKALNPIHAAAGALQDLCAEVWDNGNEHFPATSFQISNINAGTGAENVIPGDLYVMFNFRYSTAVTEDELKMRTSSILERHELEFDIDWRLSGAPFLSRPGVLIDTVCEVLLEFTGQSPELSTGGGTSDGRFIAPTGTEVMELGPLNATIHKIDEHVSIDDLVALERVYFEIMKKMLT